MQEITVFPKVPKKIERLKELAYNLYWSWNQKIQTMFESIEPELFKQINRNPVRLLLEVKQADLDRVAESTEFLEHYESAVKAFDRYCSQKKEPKIAYFSMEYGFHESVQIYSGGLGILAGDHCKSASDLDLPFVAVGLFFREGYFHQFVNSTGWQEEFYQEANPDQLPLKPVMDGENPLKIWLELTGRSIAVRAWKLEVGRISVILLDTDCEENSPQDREITARLYGGNQEMRANQELVLGVAGARVLAAMGIKPEVFHMNEGHAAFLGLERMRILINEEGLDFYEAIEAVASNAIFTTHTPVPAGNDAFDFQMIDRGLGHWYDLLKTNREEFLELGRHDQPWGPTFSMTVLALKLSRFHNGVSELHGEVSRKMWNFLWPGALTSEVPIGHVTNGIHTRTFLAPALGELFDRYFAPNWDDRIEDPKTWEAIDQIPNDDLWQIKQDLKQKLIRFVREKLQKQYIRHEASAAKIAQSAKVLREDALTIGFARRFATYKRANLLFRDLEKLKKLVNDQNRPVQFIFAGKAHPADNPGKEFIQAIYNLSQDPDLAGKVIFLEDYDMNVARHLVQGCDIWLNNPRRPLEASGTSGQKAGLNGCLNFSILDGWWRESFDGNNGFSIGDEREYHDLSVQDDVDAFSLIETLEKEIIPSYFATDSHGKRTIWLEKIRNSIKTIAPKFSMQRQVIDYSNKYYQPASKNYLKIQANHCAMAKELAKFRLKNRERWQSIAIKMEKTSSVAEPGQSLPIKAYVLTAGLGNLRVEAVLTDEENVYIFDLKPGAEKDGWTEYEGSVVLPEAGTFTLRTRVYPYHSGQTYPLELGLVTWS